MKKWKVVLLFLTISCAKYNGVIDQLYIDYFPVREGMKWIYRTPDSLIVVREVLQDTEVSPSLNLVQIEMLGDLEYYKKSPDLLALVYEYSKFINGNEVIFDKADLLLFYQPVLENQFFTDTMSQIIVLGDTFRYTRVFNSQIIKGTGERRNLLYSINATLKKGGLEEKQSIFAHIVLAPDTGPVYMKKVFDSDTLELCLEQFLK